MDYEHGLMTSQHPVKTINIIEKLLAETASESIPLLKGSRSSSALPTKSWLLTGLSAKPDCYCVGCGHGQAVILANETRVIVIQWPTLSNKEAVEIASLQAEGFEVITIPRLAGQTNNTIVVVRLPTQADDQAA